MTKPKEPSKATLKAWEDASNECGYHFADGHVDVWVQFLMAGPDGERLEEHLFHFKQLTLVQE